MAYEEEEQGMMEGEMENGEYELPEEMTPVTFFKNLSIRKNTWPPWEQGISSQRLKSFNS